MIEKMFDMIREAKYAVALTGAGASTLSGIPDFRGKDGLYSKVDAEKIFDIEWFKRDPSIYYGAASEFIYNVNEKKPSIAHTVLADLESLGFLKALITQNIDMLHTRAGSKNVIEIHGSPKNHYCLKCPRVEMGFDEAAEIARRGEAPRCPKCGAALKPAITFFGEALPQRALQQAVEEASRADLMLVIGTSLTVYPAAAMPEYALRGGARLIIVNAQPTGLDDYAALRIEDIAQAFEGLRDLLAQG